MKTGSPLVVGRILVGLCICLCLTPAFLSAQDKSSRGMSISLGRKPEVRRQAAPSRRNPPVLSQSSWFSPTRRTVTTTRSGTTYAAQDVSLTAARPQAQAAPSTVSSISSSYGTASRTVRYNDTQMRSGPSQVSFLPDGTVVTREATYSPPPTHIDPAYLDPVENPLTSSGYYPSTGTSMTPPVQFPNSAMAPPPPPVERQYISTAVPKVNPDEILQAERVSGGLVKSPYPPYSMLDVHGLRPGSLAQDPASKKLFRVP